VAGKVPRKPLPPREAIDVVRSGPEILKVLRRSEASEVAAAKLAALRAEEGVRSRAEAFRRAWRELLRQYAVDDAELWRRQPALIAEYSDVLTRDQSWLSTLQMVQRCSDQVVKLQLLAQRGASGALLSELRGWVAEMTEGTSRLGEEMSRDGDGDADAE